MKKIKFYLYRIAMALSAMRWRRCHCSFIFFAALFFSAQVIIEMVLFVYVVKLSNLLFFTSVTVT